MVVLPRTETEDIKGTTNRGRLPSLPSFELKLFVVGVVEFVLSVPYVSSNLTKEARVGRKIPLSLEWCSRKRSAATGFFIIGNSPTFSFCNSVTFFILPETNWELVILTGTPTNSSLYSLFCKGPPYYTGPHDPSTEVPSVHRVPINWSRAEEDGRNLVKGRVSSLGSWVFRHRRNTDNLLHGQKRRGGSKRCGTSLHRRGGVSRFVD